MGVSQNYGYHFGVTIIRTIVIWDLYGGPPILGNYQMHTSLYRATVRVILGAALALLKMSQLQGTTCSHASQC